MDENPTTLRPTSVLLPAHSAPSPCRVACFSCGGRLIEIRGKLCCSECHRIQETCCEGARG